MANHAARGTQKPPDPELPVLRWATIVRTDKGHHLATMETQGDRIVSRTLSDPDNWRPVTERRFVSWVAENILDREQNP